MEIVSELFNIMTKVFLLVLRKEWMLSLVARPGCKDTSMLISDIAFWLQLPPTAGGELSFFVVSCVDLYFLISEKVP